jgi:hypothetical protein
VNPTDTFTGRLRFDYSQAPIICCSNRFAEDRTSLSSIEYASVLYTPTELAPIFEIDDIQYGGKV